MFKKYRLNFVYVVLIVSTIAFVIFDITLYVSLKEYLYLQTFNEMRMKTSLAVKLLEQKRINLQPSNIHELKDLASQLEHIANSRVTIIDSTGRVLIDSDVPDEHVPLMDNHIKRPEVQDAINSGWGQSYRDSDTIRRKLFYTAFTIRNEGRIIGFLRLAYYAQKFEESLNKIIVLMIAANVFGLVTLFVGAFYLGTLVTLPILKIVRTAKTIAAGDLNRSFPTHRKDEIGTLAEILNELTERLKSQIIQVSNERSKLQDILINLDIGIIVIDLDKNILNVNSEVYRILGMNSYEIEHRNLIEILQAEPLLTAIEKSLDEGSKESGEFTCSRQERKIFISYVITPFFISEEKMNGALIQLQDITELKTLEAIRRDFVANASHELKTPLTAIIGYAETLHGGAGEDHVARTKFIWKILEQSQRLEFLVQDLLLLSKMEREEPLQLMPCPLQPMIREIVDEFREKSSLKNINISVVGRQKVILQVNEESIRVVFNNLLDNAIKYTPENGSITVRISELENSKVRIEFIDTGIGIEPKYHDRIFQRFYRVDKARSRAIGGTGLGLAIVKHIIERHGSKIHIQSQEGKGSNFWFELNKAE
ncbi:MAG: ATP-binding protein [Candidatus Zhuqueibacterota bacterium]